MLSDVTPETLEEYLSQDDQSCMIFTDLESAVSVVIMKHEIPPHILNDDLTLWHGTPNRQLREYLAWKIKDTINYDYSY